MNDKPREKKKPPSKRTNDPIISPPLADGYENFLGEVSLVLAEARKQAVRAVNTILAATYWEIGRRIVEFEQGGRDRAGYGEALLEHLSMDMGRRFGRGFSVDNLESMRLFYLAYPESGISETAPRKSVLPEKSETLSRIFSVDDLATAFPLSWSHMAQEIETTRRLLDERSNRKKEAAQ